MEPKETTISIMVNNKPDVLARIAGTFSARGFNIESISANTTSDPSLTRIVITTRHNRDVIRKIEKQLQNIVDVRKVDNLSRQRSVHRELLLIKVKAEGDHAALVEKLVSERNWRRISQNGTGQLLEITGDQGEILAALRLLEPFGIVDYARTGVVALELEKNLN